MDDITAGFVNRTSRGAAAELLACVHLMRTGWQTFRSDSPSCPFDVAAYRDGRFLRVEVKSITEHGHEGYAPGFAWPTNDEWDLLLVVNPNDGKIIEISTHDPVEARNLVRASYGFAPIAARRTRAELRDIASGGRAYRRVSA